MNAIAHKLVDTFSLRRRMQRLLRNQRGALLMETTMALVVFGVVGTAVLGAVQTSFTSKRHFAIQSEAENIVRNQMEYVLEQPYKPPVDVYLTVTPPQGFTLSADALIYSATSTDISTVRVTVYHQGTLIKSFDTLRTNR